MTDVMLERAMLALTLGVEWARLAGRPSGTDVYST